MLHNLASSLIAVLALSQSVLSFPLTRRLDDGAALRNVQYVQTFTDRSGNWFNLTDLVTQNTGLTHLILASLHLDNPTQIHLNDNDIESAYWDPLWPMVSSLQAAGVKVMLMMGGAARGSYANLQNDFDTYYPIILSILKNHNLDGFDMDVEENVSESVLLRLAQQLDADMGSDFILTAAPVALSMSNGGNLDNVSWPALDQVAISSERPNGKLFNWYNTQFYDGWGSAATTDSYDTVISAGWDPSRIVLGVLTSATAGYSWQPTSVLSSTITSLKAKYEHFGGVYGWEYGLAGETDGETPVQWVASIGRYLAAEASDD
ncbi:hypothetical protein TMatcc_009751 [Talaromyces marneffei ATCC 18224]|uniref:GH18 domain-containing protein n=1 Tax=Talaromyces marneffei (strain ATCC 18224 / CBS 334.59 / QM 7333) TaxID=441960 RepID=B6QT34_TALMQ|nr:uncharacterized protein EYB26_008989 [Talaromyces marneffei]EEA19613.1 conserved hypothetical protein [Talaromyces marneffei ATCC 18224]KAE8547928.1 hypothetical protein EYB25_009721 [Talaromyces marneffei]QGA21279.1 hypothetical protein EYB26_008989 [Talaromyces marneffei]